MPKELMGERASQAGDDMAQTILRLEMVRRQLSNRDLVRLLKQININENERNLSNKIARGKFPAGFLLLCFFAMGVEAVRLDYDYAYLREKWGLERPLPPPGPVVIRP